MQSDLLNIYAFSLTYTSDEIVRTGTSFWVRKNDNWTNMVEWSIVHFKWLIRRICWKIGKLWGVLINVSIFLQFLRYHLDQSSNFPVRNLVQISLERNIF